MTARRLPCLLFCTMPNPQPRQQLMKDRARLECVFGWNSLREQISVPSGTVEWRTIVSNADDRSWTNAVVSWSSACCSVVSEDAGRLSLQTEQRGCLSPLTVLCRMWNSAASASNTVKHDNWYTWWLWNIWYRGRNRSRQIDTNVSINKQARLPRKNTQTLVNYGRL